MQNKSIYKSIKFIEKNIEERLTVELVASYVGYSKFYFSRLFKQTMGSSVGEYIKERRLTNAAKDILEGMKIIDVAVKYGYETHTGFDKAFKQKFGYPPSLLYAMSLSKVIFSSIGGVNMNHEQLFSELYNDIETNLNEFEKDKLKKAYEFALETHKNQKRYSGEPYVTHPLNVAKILANMDVPFNTILLGILHESNCENKKVFKHLVDEFGIEILGKISKIQKFDMNIELLEVVDVNEEEDVILVKLADRLHNMKTLEHLDYTRWKEKATETLQVFSPLAERIGVTELKLELDHLSLKHI